VHAPEEEDCLVHELHRGDAGRVLVEDAVGVDRLRAIARTIILLRAEGERKSGGRQVSSRRSDGCCRPTRTDLAALASHEGIHCVTARSSIMPAHSEAADESVSMVNLLARRRR